MGQSRLYFRECLTTIRTLGIHKTELQPCNSMGRASSFTKQCKGYHDGIQNSQINNIMHQTRLRIFWAMFVISRSIQQLGEPLGELHIPPPSTLTPYPPLPDEADDQFIHGTYNDPQRENPLPLIAGFNANVRIYSSYDSFAVMLANWGIDAAVDWQAQKQSLLEALVTCKDTVLDLPLKLSVRSTASVIQAGGLGSGLFNDPSMPLPVHHQSISTLFDPNPNQPVMRGLQPRERRLLQHQIQKANIHASSLATRSYLVEEYRNFPEVLDRRAYSHSPNSTPRSHNLTITPRRQKSRLFKSTPASTRRLS
jgi:hypothetical protein